MFGTPIKNWTKGESSPVSEADIAVDQLLHERLTGEGSGFGWLSEESLDDPARLASRYVWIVDPIDGTRAYLAGLPDWAVSAALVENGRPIVACLLRAGDGRVLHGDRRQRRHAATAPRSPSRAARHSRTPASPVQRVFWNGSPSRRRPSPSCRAYARWRSALPAWRRATTTPPLPAATVTTGTLRRLIFWCTKLAAR